MDEEDSAFAYRSRTSVDGAADVRIPVTADQADVAVDFSDSAPASTMTDNSSGSNQTESWVLEEGMGERRASTREFAAAGLGTAQSRTKRRTIIDEPPSFGDYPVRETPPEMLRSGNLKRLVSVGSINPMARRSSQSMEWSDKAVIEEQTDQMSLMDSYYDLTRTRLAKLFMCFEPDEEGMVSYEGFRRGLEAMGISTSTDEQFAAFVDKVDEDHSGGISFNEFLHVVQEIKLAQLFNGEFIREMGLDEAGALQMHHGRMTAVKGILGSVEYSSDRIRSVYPVHDIEKFVYSKKPSWAKVRWMNVEGIDILLLRRLSVRYRLHPLAVEDVLDIDRERPKYEEYDEHSSLILQTVHACDLSKLKTYQRMYRASMYSREDQKSPIDAMGRRELEERLDELAPGRVMSTPDQLSLLILKNVVISVQESPSTLWTVVKSRLDTSYSKVRQHGTPFLVYTIVDACVDELSPIVHTLGAKLVMLDRLMHLEPNSFDVNRLSSVSKQIKGLKVLCKPLGEVIKQLRLYKQFDGDIQRYFRDVQDHLTAVDEDCDRHLDTCRTLNDEFRNVREAQHSDVSYILALVAALFLPAQFLTGLYGMNFENMPELTYHYGYYIWWAIVLLIAAIVILYFKYYKRWL